MQLESTLRLKFKSCGKIRNGSFYFELMSFMKTTNNNEPMMEPCGTPDVGE